MGAWVSTDMEVRVNPKFAIRGFYAFPTLQLPFFHLYTFKKHKVWPAEAPSRLLRGATDKASAPKYSLRHQVNIMRRQEWHYDDWSDWYTRVGYRKSFIRRELPRSQNVSSGFKPYHRVVNEGSPYRGHPCRFSFSKNTKPILGESWL